MSIAFTNVRFLAVAKSVIKELLDKRGQDIKLATLIKQHTADFYPKEKLERPLNGDNPIVRRLRKRFLLRRDDYLTRTTMDNDDDRRQILQTIQEIADRLERLNVNVNREALTLKPTR